MLQKREVRYAPLFDMIFNYTHAKGKVVWKKRKNSFKKIRVLRKRQVKDKY
jgi:hypothetical protein